MLPEIKNMTKKAQQTIDVFRGLNRGYDCADNEFSEMENMSGEDFPCLVTRKSRKALSNLTTDGQSLDMIIADHDAKDTYDKGTGVKITTSSYDYYYRGQKQNVFKTAYFKKKLSTGLSGTQVGDHKVDSEGYLIIEVPFSNDIQGLITFGNHVISYPKPEIINKDLPGDSITDDSQFNRSLLVYDVFGVYPIGRYSNNSNVFRLTSADNSVSAQYYKNQEGDLTFDEISGACVLNVNIGSNSSGAMNGFSAQPGDIYKIVVFSGQGNNQSFGSTYGFLVVTSILQYYNKNSDLYNDYKNYLVRVYNNDGTLIDDGVSIISETIGSTGYALVHMKADVNLLTVHQNRIWGTDTTGRSLYCSNATDIYNWSIDGTDAGGGYVDVPENSPWTALCTYNGYLYSFKANKMYKVMGSTALDYQAVSIYDIGCTNQEAFCVCYGMLFFLSQDGVYAYTGNMPVMVSEKLGTDYKSGKLFSRGDMVYASLKRMDGVCEFLVYDAKRQTWHKEDDFNVASFVNYTDGLYALGTDKVCYKLSGGNTAAGQSFSFETKTYFYMFDKKTVTCAYLHVDTEETTKATVYIRYDGGEKEVCVSFSSGRIQYIPVRIKKCDTFSISVSGSGFLRLKNIEFSLRAGGRGR